MGVGKTLEELQKDPNFNLDDWEECEDEDNFIIIWWWRIVGAMIAITIVGFVFWIMEEQKKRQREEDEKTKLQRDDQSVRSGNEKFDSTIHLTTGSSSTDSAMVANGVGNPPCAAVSQNIFGSSNNRSSGSDIIDPVNAQRVESVGSETMGNPRAVPDSAEGLRSGMDEGGRPTLQWRGTEETTATSPSMREAEMKIDGSTQGVRATDQQSIQLDSEYEKARARLFPDVEDGGKVGGTGDNNVAPRNQPDSPTFGANSDALNVRQSGTQALTSSRGSEHSEEVVFVMKPKRRVYEEEEDSDDEMTTSEEVSSTSGVKPVGAPPTPSTELEIGGMSSIQGIGTDPGNNLADRAMRQDPIREIVSAPPDAPENDEIPSPVFMQQQQSATSNMGASVQQGNSSGKRPGQHEDMPPVIVPLALKKTPSGKWEEEEENFEGDDDEELPSVTTAPEIESFVADSFSAQLEIDSEMVVEELPEDVLPVRDAPEPAIKMSEKDRLQQKLKGQISQEIQDIADHLDASGSAPGFTAVKSSKRKEGKSATAKKEDQNESSKRRSSPKADEDSMGFTEDTESSDRKLSSMLEVVGVSSMAEALKKIETLKEVSDIMRKAGLQSSNLIFGIDYTASNKYQGEISFDGRSLHSITPGLPNPYQQVITIMGKTLAPFATSGFIPAFGFGDVHTSDWSVFPLKQGDHCTSFDEVLEVYNAVTPKIILSGPTNFAPLIYQAMDICQACHDYHILVIVADGQVTNERATRRAIVDACKFPLSIVVVGVGDGPWDMMRVFDDSLPKRPWDNFHFVEFFKIMQEADEHADLTFAVQSLLEIPDQYKKIKQMGLLDS